MIRLFENHWDTLKPFLLYKEGETPGEKPKAEAEIKEGAPETTVDTPKAVWDKEIEPQYGMDAFEKKMKAEADKIYRESVSATAAEAVPQGSFTVQKEDLVRRSMQSYGETYNTTMKMFLVKGNEFYNDKHKAIEKVEKKTQDELSNLRAEIGLTKEADKRGKEAVNVGKELKTWLTSQKPDILRYINKKEIKDRFADYVTALNNFYLDENWGKTTLAMPVVYDESYRTTPVRKEFHIPIIKPDIGPHDLEEAYVERSKFLKGRFEDIYEAKLDYLLSKKDTNLDTLKNFQKEIEDDYKKYASFDNRPGAIDLNDIGQMEYIARPSLNVINLLNTRGDKMNMEMLEMIQLMNPEAWETAIELAALQISNDAEGSGLEKLFIEAANEHSGKKFENFKDAKKYVADKSAKYAKIGVKESMDFINSIHKKVNAERITIIDSVKPPTLAQMAYYERERLLSRRLVPQDDREKLLVEFVSTGKEGREMIMKENGDLLFKTIRNVKFHYEKIYTDTYAKSMQNKKTFTTRSSDRELPTNDDRAARIQALIMISKEAEFLVNNIGTPEMKEKFKNTGPDTEPIKPDLRFTDTRKMRRVPYRSALFRGGFNGRDLGMNALKVIGVFTVVSNALNCIREADKGDGWIDKIGNSLTSIVSNPAVLAGAAVTVGAQTLSMNPEYYGYLHESEYGRASINTTRKLRSLSSRLGRPYVKNFVHNENEWMAMDRLTSAQIKSLMKDAQKRNPKSPMITRSDIEKTVQDKEVIAGIPEGNTSAGTRYRFYQNFLTGNEKPNIGQLKEMCQKDKIVS